MKKPTAAALLCLLFLFARAENFTVSSNADSGPGSFREALLLAAANGTASYDTIRFNLADLTEAGRTIAYTTKLPELSSKLVIDGTTQPGMPVGVSNAKVILKAGSPYLYVGLVLLRASQVELYGLCFTDIPRDPDLSFSGAIYGYAASDVVIGKPGKGNLFYNCGLGIHFSGLYANRDSLNQRLTVQGNIFGLVGDGETAQSNFQDALFENSTDVLVGGDSGSEANYFTAWQEGIKVFSFNYSNAPFTDAGFFRIRGNYFGLSYRTQKSIATTQAISAEGWMFPTQVSLDIQNNDLRNSSILLQRIDPRFTIKGNRIQIIWINWCKSGVIGGPGDERNFIGPNSQYAGVNVYQSDTITITRNVIFCNAKGISLAQAPWPLITINSITDTEVRGASNTFATVEVFGLDTCTGQCQNGTVFLGSTKADANGEWVLPISFKGVISATATLPSGKTSEFAAARLNTRFVTVKQPGCGNKNGAIEGALLESGTEAYWEDQNGNMVGTSLDLTGVGPGAYRLVGKLGNSSCKTVSPFFFLYDTPKPQLSAGDLVLSQPACGAPNGKIEYRNGLNPNWLYWWYKDGVLFDSSNAGALAGLAPGTYALVVRSKADTACKSSPVEVVLKNPNGPSLNTADVVVSPAVCGNNNGSIKGITAINTTGTIHVAWLDSLNKVVGSNFDLQNAGPGNYRLRFKDEGGCDTLFTAFFSIAATGLITFDTTRMVVAPAKCSGEGGSIRGIKITGGEKYVWKNTATQAVAGSTPDIDNLPAGLYQLTVTNNDGCSKTLPPVEVPQASFQSIAVLESRAVVATCGQPNGFVHVQRFSRDTGLYTFRWIDSATRQTVSRSTQLNNIYNGTYLLFAKDASGCEQQILNALLIGSPLPSFDYTGLRITPDNCLSGSGAIQGVTVKNLSNGTAAYAWINSNGETVGRSRDINGLPQGTYRLQVMDPAGCTVTSQPIVVASTTGMLPPPQYDAQTILKNTSATLQVKNHRPGTYRLYPDPSAVSVVQENGTGVFTTPVLNTDQTFYVRYDNGVCRSELVAVQVKVVDKTAVYVPTAFTPNGDGRNDVLKPVTYGRIKPVYFTIYNRWGQVIFTTTDFSKGWDGRINGQPVETGVYVWTVKAVDESNGHTLSEKGTVTVVR